MKVLQHYWGYKSFREPQEKIIQSILEGRDTLALLPTGGGKSICFQVPALMREGLCLVVSPLIALMKDQVYNLQKRNIPAAAIFSGMPYRDIDRTFDNCIYGNTKLLYVSPERLQTELAKERIKQMKINLIAVDEAHCISQWGYDFRPSYLSISEIRTFLPRVPILALTATATPEVVIDIQDRLLFKQKHVIQKSFTRKNLVYVALHEENKYNKLLDIAEKVKGSAIVYVRNRKATKDVARFLASNKISSDFYNAGLQSELRSQKQEKWIEGKTRVMVCTNAFGMGIDKPDVRLVVHLDLPESLEAYFQEAGRAGRDGKVSYAVLLYSEEDKTRLERHFKLSFPRLDELKRVYRALASYFQVASGQGVSGDSYDFNMADFCRVYNFEPYLTFSCLKLLEQEGWVSLTESFYLPSSFRLLLDRAQLYDYQLKNPEMDMVIKALLRVTEGAFFHFANLNEKAIARYMEIPESELRKRLHYLHKERIIEYKPAKDEPQLMFTRERVPADELTIDIELYNFLKNRHEYRMEKAIEYANSNDCRSQVLLRYLGESAPQCGNCDICLGRKDENLSAEDYNRYKAKIEQLLRKERLTESQIADSFSSVRQPKVIAALSFLMDEGLIIKKDGVLVWVDKR